MYLNKTNNNNAVQLFEQEYHEKPTEEQLVRF